MGRALLGVFKKIFEIEKGEKSSKTAKNKFDLDTKLKVEDIEPRCIYKRGNVGSPTSYVGKNNYTAEKLIIKEKNESDSSEIYKTTRLMILLITLMAIFALLMMLLLVVVVF